jgi:hypothetical protein
MATGAAAKQARTEGGGRLLFLANEQVCIAAPRLSELVHRDTDVEVAPGFRIPGASGSRAAGSRDRLVCHVRANGASACGARPAQNRPDSPAFLRVRAGARRRSALATSRADRSPLGGGARRATDA